MDIRSIHILVEFWGCAEDLDDAGFVRDHMKAAAHEANTIPLNILTRHHKAGGVSVLIATEENHLSIHTWPQKKYAALDVFVRASCSPDKAVEYIRMVLGPRRLEIAKLIRGVEGGIEMTSFTNSDRLV